MTKVLNAEIEAGFDSSKILNGFLNISIRGIFASIKCFRNEHALMYTIGNNDQPKATAFAAARICPAHL